MTQCVFSATNVYEAELVSAFLERSGIKTEIRNAYASVLGGDGWVEVHVDDASADEAHRRVQDGNLRLKSGRRRKQSDIARPDWTELLDATDPAVYPRYGAGTDETARICDADHDEST